MDNNIKKIDSLILLFGGRPEPNALLLHTLKPTKVVALVSMQTNYNVQARLSGVVSSGSIVVERVDPYNLRSLQEVIRRYVDGDTAIGITGAPMPMAISAYEVAQQNNIPVYYVNTAQGEILDLLHKDHKPLEIKISLNTFFSIYKLNPDPSISSPTFATTLEQRKRAARFLVQNIRYAGSLLSWLRKDTNVKEGGAPLKLHKEWPSQFSQGHWDILQHLNNLQILSVSIDKRKKYPAINDKINIQFPSIGERGFIFGEWLEIYVADVARSLGILDDVKQGLRFKVGNVYREIDFIGIFRGIPLLGSCKVVSKKVWNKTYLDEISAVADIMGGRYTWRFFFTDRVPPTIDNKKAYQSFRVFKEQAHQLRVRIVTGKELDNWDKILKNELKSPTYPLV